MSLDPIRRVCSASALFFLLTALLGCGDADPVEASPMHAEATTTHTLAVDPPGLPGLGFALNVPTGWRAMHGPSADEAMRVLAHFTDGHAQPTTLDVLAFAPPAEVTVKDWMVDYADSLGLRIGSSRFVAHPHRPVLELTAEGEGHHHRFSAWRHGALILSTSAAIPDARRSAVEAAVLEAEGSLAMKRPVGVRPMGAVERFAESGFGGFAFFHPADWKQEVRRRTRAHSVLDLRLQLPERLVALIRVRVMALPEGRFDPEGPAAIERDAWRRSGAIIEAPGEIEPLGTRFDRPTWQSHDALRFADAPAGLTCFVATGETHAVAVSLFLPEGPADEPGAMLARGAFNLIWRSLGMASEIDFQGAEAR